MNTVRRAISVAAVTLLLTLLAAPARANTEFAPEWGRIGSTTLVTINGVQWLRIPAGGSATTPGFQAVLAQNVLVEVCVDSYTNGQTGALWLFSEVFDVGGAQPNLLRFTYTGTARQTRCKPVAIASDYPDADFRVDMGVSGVEARRDTVRSVKISPL